MADGAERSGSDVGIGITGIADLEAARRKPVGTVAIAVKAPSAKQVRTFQFLGGRDMVKFQSTQAAMNMLRLILLDARLLSRSKWSDGVESGRGRTSAACGNMRDHHSAG
jgi:hypothetical protein